MVIKKRLSSQDNQEVTLCVYGGVSITHCVHMQEVTIQNVFIYVWSVLAYHNDTRTHARTNAAKLYPFHLNWRAHSPSRSTGAQSLTTDIILIAHRGWVVCPHSHPDSQCAENPTTENGGLRVSGGLRTAESVHRVSSESIPLSSPRLHCFISQEHGSSRAQAKTGVRGMFWTRSLRLKKKRGHLSTWMRACLHALGWVWPSLSPVWQVVAGR